jgi:4-hydroxybenzoate polyprenyltransferase
MMRRVRLLVLIARPAVVVLLGLFAATGLAQAQHAEDPVLLGRVLVVVFGFLLFSVACNDIADEAVDRVNLPHDPRRPLVAGTARRHELVVVAVTAAVVSLAASATLHWPAVVVTAAGLLVSAGYSLRPVRLAQRGMVASLVLPACYVAVPYLLGGFAVRDRVPVTDLVLLAGLYLGFIGRILLKDFRDVRGDALFGKRTFLVRHGRSRTCLVSAGFWVAGTVVSLAGVARPGVALVAVTLACLGIALALLRALSAAPDPHREEALVSAIAIVGRGQVLAVLAHLAMTDARWSGWASGAVLSALLAITAVQSMMMARQGPPLRPWPRTPGGVGDRPHHRDAVPAGGGSRPR